MQNLANRARVSTKVTCKHDGVVVEVQARLTSVAAARRLCCSARDLVGSAFVGALLCRASVVSLWLCVLAEQFRLFGGHGALAAGAFKWQASLATGLHFLWSRLRIPPGPV